MIFKTSFMINDWNRDLIKMSPITTRLLLVIEELCFILITLARVHTHSSTQLCVRLHRYVHFRTGLKFGCKIWPHSRSVFFFLLHTWMKLNESFYVEAHTKIKWVFAVCRHSPIVSGVPVKFSSLREQKVLNQKVNNLCRSRSKRSLTNVIFRDEKVCVVWSHERGSWLVKVGQASLVSANVSCELVSDNLITLSAVVTTPLGSFPDV